VSLSATNVQWLKQLPGTVAEDDLDVAYGFAHPLNGSRRLSKETLSGSGKDEHLLWWITIYDTKEEPVLEAPLARKIYARTPLRSVRENGPIVYNALFKIKEGFQRQGLAKHLYAAEGVLYRKWGLKEIHINARDDGLIVWVKNFGFLPQLPDVLATEYGDWAGRRGLDPTPPVRAADYPAEFLRARDTLELFKVVE
jgi:hypothetical protein